MNKILSRRQTIDREIGDRQLSQSYCFESFPTKQKSLEYNNIILIASVLLSYCFKSSTSLKKETVNSFQPETSTDENIRPKLPKGTLLISSVLLTFWLSPYLRNYWSNATTVKTTINPTKLNLDNALPVETIAVGTNNINKVWRSYSGTLVARRQSSLSLERLGKIARINVEEGDRITAGTILASLDTTKLLAKKQELLARRKQLLAELEQLQLGSRAETIATARYNLQDWQNQLELARTKQQRRQQLYNSGAISLELFNEATTETKSLQARVQQAQSELNELLAGNRPQAIAAQQAVVEQLDASLASLSVDIAQSSLKAPFSGTIAKRMVDEGTVVAASQPILNIVEDGSLEARIGVPVDVAAKISIGSEQQLEVGLNTYKATVLSISPQLDPTSRTVTVVLGLKSATTQLRSGQTVKLKLAETIATEDGYWLPTSALARGVRGLWTCYVLGDRITENGKTAFAIERRDLEVLHTEGDRVLVRGTLQSGDRAIVNGTHRLVPDLLVQIN